MRNRVTRQGSKDSTDGSTNSNSSDGTCVPGQIPQHPSKWNMNPFPIIILPPPLRFVFPTTRLGPESQFSDFLDGLGPAQIVGRQTLATPPMGKLAARATFTVQLCSHRPRKRGHFLWNVHENVLMCVSGFKILTFTHSYTISTIFTYKLWPIRDWDLVVM